MKIVHDIVPSEEYIKALHDVTELKPTGISAEGDRLLDVMKQAAEDKLGSIK